MNEPKSTNSVSRSKTQYASPEDELLFLRRRAGELETQNQQLYQQAFLLQQRLSASDVNERERAEFISHVAHELRTPLTSIKGYVDLVLEGETGPINDMQRDFLGVVGLNAEKLSRIIGDLLDVSRLEAGQLAFKPDLVDVTELALEISAQVRPQLESRGVQLEVQTQTDTALIASLDAERFSQALRAIIAHAGEVTPGGKTVHFWLGLSKDGQQIEIRVEDEGPGIDQVDLERVFTKFWRPQNQVWREEIGAGLGLAIARTIIDLHEGKVRAENRASEGGGSVIIVNLPLIGRPDELASFFTVTLPQETPHYAALVISRDADFGRVIEQTLGGNGFQVIVAQDRAELMSETPSWQPDLIINNGAEFDLSASAEDKQIAPALRGAAVLTLNLSPIEQRMIAVGARAVLPWPASDNLIVDSLEQTIMPDQPMLASADFKSQQTILLVSPSSDSLRSLDKLIHEAGFSRVYRAMREADALTLARRYRPSWLLLDVASDLEENEETASLFEMLHEDQLLSKTPTIIFLRPDQIAPDPSPNYQPTPASGRRGATGELRSRRGSTGELGIRRGGTGELGLRRGGTGELRGPNARNTDELKGQFYNVVPKPFVQRRLVMLARRLAAHR